MKSIRRFDIVVFLVIIGFVTYLFSLFGGFIWDDEDFVHQNRYVAELQVGRLFTQNALAGRDKISNYYRPLQLSLYGITHGIFGFNPFFFHLLDIVIHICASILLFIFFEKLTRKKFLPFLIATIFLIHPVQTEAVSYVSGMSDPLFVFFGFLTLILFLKKETHIGYYFASLGAFILALLSKESALVFAGIVAILSVTQHKWKKIEYVIPYFVIAFLYLAMHFSFFNQQDIRSAWGDSPYGQSVIVRISTFIEALYTYIGLLVFPHTLHMERDYTTHIQTQFFNMYLAGFIFLNVGIIAFLYLQRKKLENIQLLIFSYLSFFAAFSISSGVVLINGVFYEHFLYLPMIFFFAFLFFLLEKYLYNRVAYYILAILYVLLIGRSYLRQYEWIEPVRFYEQTLQYAPQSTRIRNNLGMAYAEKGKLDEAIREYNAGVKMEPRIPNFYHNLGNAYVQKNDLKTAEKYYLKAIEVSPKFSFSYGVLWKMYEYQKDEKKLNDLKLRIKKNFPDTKF